MALYHVAGISIKIANIIKTTVLSFSIAWEAYVVPRSLMCYNLELLFNSSTQNTVQNIVLLGPLRKHIPHFSMARFTN
jgi:hypothetical protein